MIECVFTKISSSKIIRTDSVCVRFLFVANLVSTMCVCIVLPRAKHAVSNYLCVVEYIESIFNIPIYIPIHPSTCKNPLSCFPTSFDSLDLLESPAGFCVCKVLLLCV